MKTTDWTGCYDLNWNGKIHPLAYQHPAKFACGLVWRIFDHLLTTYDVHPGDTVVDPFGGVGLGAEPATALGLDWVGVELEQKFVDLGQGCDCTGMSKTDWVRFYGRWDRANYKDGRHWCPQCLDEVKRVDENTATQLTLFGSPTPTASYKRNSGQIPHTQPHHFPGNIELFLRRPEAKGSAVLLQGDSRRLCEVVAEAGVLVSSPPYSRTNVGNGDGENELKRLQRKAASGQLKGEHLRLAKQGRLSPNEQANLADYGRTPGQLAAMPEGRVVPQGGYALVGSPPFYDNRALDDNEKHRKWWASRRTASGRDPSANGGTPGTYGVTSSNLANLPEGSPLLVSSPPFAGNTGGRGEASRNGIDPALFDRHQGGMVGGIGSTGNLAGLKPGAVPEGGYALVGSPPFGQSDLRKGGSDLLEQNALRRGRNPYLPGTISNITPDPYGTAPGQLGTESDETFWSAAAVILDQCCQILPPGAPAVWVLKSFVRDGAVVDFPGQWQALCEANGFETVEVVRAWLVKDKGTQMDLNGNGHKKTVKRASFFRRLHERKYPHLSIDFETVLFTRRIS